MAAGPSGVETRAGGVVRAGGANVGVDGRVVVASGRCGGMTSGTRALPLPVTGGSGSVIVMPCEAVVDGRSGVAACGGGAAAGWA